MRPYTFPHRGVQRGRAPLRFFLFPQKWGGQRGLITHSPVSFLRQKDKSRANPVESNRIQIEEVPRCRNSVLHSPGWPMEGN
jgi:hypothetical protein